MYLLLDVKEKHILDFQVLDVIKVIDLVDVVSLVYGLTRYERVYRAHF